MHVDLKTPLNSINMISIPKWKDYLFVITICTTRSITKENILPIDIKTRWDNGGLGVRDGRRHVVIAPAELCVSEWKNVHIGGEIKEKWKVKR